MLSSCFAGRLLSPIWSSLTKLTLWTRNSWQNWRRKSGNLLIIKFISVHFKHSLREVHETKTQCFHSICSSTSILHVENYLKEFWLNFAIGGSTLKFWGNFNCDWYQSSIIPMLGEAHVRVHQFSRKWRILRYIIWNT